MFEREKVEIELDREHISSEMETIKKEQEDLLLLLSEQETKIKLFKDRLKELGEKVGGMWICLGIGLVTYVNSVTLASHKFKHQKAMLAKHHSIVIPADHHVALGSNISVECLFCIC